MVTVHGQSHCGESVGFSQLDSRGQDGEVDHVGLQQFLQLYQVLHSTHSVKITESKTFYPLSLGDAYT